MGGPPLPQLGAMLRPNREVRDEAERMSTAFEWAYASWDNAKGVVPCGRRIGRQDGDEGSALATRSVVTSAPLRTAILARPQRTVSRLHNLQFRARHTSMAVSFWLRQGSFQRLQRSLYNERGDAKHVFRTLWPRVRPRYKSATKRRRPQWIRASRSLELETSTTTW